MTDQGKTPSGAGFYLSRIAGKAALYAVAAALFFGHTNVESQAANTATAGEAQAVPAGNIVVAQYKPAFFGAPSRRVGGATRGTEAQKLTLSVLAPESAGLSHADAPVLYWYVSDDVEAKTEIVVIDSDPNAIDPIVEVLLDGPVKKGVNHLDLSQLQAKLKPDVEYQWSVALVTDENQRSLDIVSTGSVVHRPASGNLVASLDGKAANEKVESLAANGYWYDALQALGEGLEAKPGADDLMTLRANLLKEVGLDEAAAAAQK